MKCNFIIFVIIYSLNFFFQQSDSIEVGKSDEKYEEYDKIVRELAFEKRARPTNRTKSEEEIALEEKEKLERLEV
jgi:hypothetical protein